MQLEILFTDIGGQGVQLASKTFALAAVSEGCQVSLTSYPGGGMRGGRTDAEVVISDSQLTVPPIIPSAGSAFVRHPKFGRLIAPGCGRRRSWYLEPGQSVSLEEHREFCSSRLAAYKHPRKLVLVDDLAAHGGHRQVQRARLLAKVSA